MQWNPGRSEREHLSWLHGEISVRFLRGHREEVWCPLALPVTKAEVISPFPNKQDCSHLPSRQKAQKVHYTKEMVCMAREQYCNGSVDRKALRQYFDQRSSLYGPFWYSHLSHKMQPEEKDTELGNLEQHFARDGFVATVWLRNTFLQLLLSSKTRKQSFCAPQGHCKCSDKVRNIRTETYIRTLYKFKQWCTKV